MFPVRWLTAASRRTEALVPQLSPSTCCMNGQLGDLAIDPALDSSLPSLHPAYR